MMNPDDLIKAAMIEDEEDLRLKEEKSTTEDESHDEADAPDEAPEAEETEDTDEQEDRKDEAEADDEEAEDEAEDAKPTRRERREERRQRWLESVRKEQGEQRPSQTVQQPQPQPEEYTPLDYTKLDEIDEEQLVKDRESYAETQRKQGAIEAAERQKFIAEQNEFWKDVQHEAQLLNYDPKFKFLDESNPETFDPDLAADLNEKYLEFVGFDPQSSTVLRTDISYKKFLEKEMAERDGWAERVAAENQRAIQQTKATASVRPGGTRKSGLGKLKPGDISKMSDADFAKYEAEIDRQIAAELGI